MSSVSYEPELESPVSGDLITTVPSADALMALNRSEIDTQIATAKRYPRSIVAFKEQAMEMACLDEDTAATMFYALPRGGKKIEGPSVRLAEVVGSSWGNLRYGARIVAIDDKFITAQGACMDLEKNIAATVEVKRRITDKQGRRFNDDMIQTTGNAACSIALRNAIFKVVPFGLVKPVYENARLASIGKAKTMTERRNGALDWFTKAGATVEQVLNAIGRKGVEDITIDDLVTLTGLRTAIKDGETTIEDALGPVPDPKARVRKSNVNINELKHAEDASQVEPDEAPEPHYPNKAHVSPPRSTSKPRKQAPKNPDAEDAPDADEFERQNPVNPQGETLLDNTREYE